MKPFDAFRPLVDTYTVVEYRGRGYREVIKDGVTTISRNGNYKISVREITLGRQGVLKRQLEQGNLDKKQRLGYTIIDQPDQTIVFSLSNEKKVIGPKEETDRYQLDGITVTKNYPFRPIKRTLRRIISIGRK